MGSSVSKEDTVAIIDKGCEVVQSELPPSVVLAISLLMAEPPVLEGVGVYVVLLGTRDKFEGHMKTWMGVHQWSQWYVDFFCDGGMKGSGKLSDKGGLEDVWLVVKREV